MRKILVALLGLLLCASLASADTLFPNSPTTGQIYNFNNTGVLYQWDGAKWITTGTTSPAITKQIFTASGTYTPSSGMQYAIIECVGPGGGGGGVTDASATTSLAGGGGGSGSYSRAYVTAAQVGASQTVTIGTGGAGGAAGSNSGNDGTAATSVGTLCVANVGKGGGFSAIGSATGTGGAGGTAGTGDVAVAGSPGQPGWTNSAAAMDQIGANGGSSYFGGGGLGKSVSTGSAGTNGGGGSGAHDSYSGTTNRAGGNGGDGIVVITEFLSSQWGGPLPQIVNPQGRLTLTTATPVTSSDVTGATTVYYTPYKGSYAPLWNGTQFTPVYFNEISAAMGANWAANSNYDWFLYNDAGTLRICTGPAWTSDTARGSGAGTTQISQTQGIYTNTVSMTCRYSNAATVTVAAQYGLYLGTMRTTASTGTTEDSKAKRFIWNMYNRVTRQLEVKDATASWTYNTAAFREAHGLTTNQVAFVRGLDEEDVTVSGAAYATNSTTTFREGALAIGLDSTTAEQPGTLLDGYASSAQVLSMNSHYAGMPGLGYHYLAWLEYSSAADVLTFYGTSGNLQAGLFGGALQ